MSNEQNTNKNFTFSIIMAIFNTEKYLKEAIDSLISQTLDFEEHVQLILVNDGSTDSSLDIALDYQNIFPHNIYVISQENQGLGAAHNTALKYVKGKYVNFMDSDDKLSEDALSEVKNFFDQHGDATDVVSIKLMVFGRIDKPHFLNFKYDEDKLIDLVEEPFNPQLSVTSAFINVNAIKDKRFRTDLHSSVDANMMTKVLVEKKKLGVLKSPTYFYRKREDNTSMIDSSISRKDFFTDRIKNHYLDVIGYCLNKEGEVPLFIQATLAYSLQWMVTPEIPEFFTNDEKEEFIYYFNKLISYLSIETLSNKKIISSPFLCNYFIAKHNHDLHVECNDNQAIVKSRNIQLDKLSNHTFWIGNIDLNDEFITVSGSFNSMFNSDNLTFSAIIEDEDGNIESYPSIPSEKYSRDNISFFSQTIQYVNCFDMKIPLRDDEVYNIKIGLSYRDGTNTVCQFPKIGLNKTCFNDRLHPIIIDNELNFRISANMEIIQQDMRNNKILGYEPELIKSDITFMGMNNILICEKDVILENSYLNFGGNNSIIYLSTAKYSHSLNIQIFHNSVFFIDENASYGGPITCTLSEEKNILIGKDALFSKGIKMRLADPHLIYDVNEKKRINLSKSIFIGDHVWIGQDAMLLKGSQIGSGSIVGAKSLVSNKKLHSNSAWGGVPVKKIRDEVFFEKPSANLFTSEHTEKYMISENDEWIYSNEGEILNFDEIDKKLSGNKDLKEKIELLKDIKYNKSHNRFFIGQ